jgi:hypothetical protein
MMMAAVWLLLSLVAIKVFSASSCSAGRSDLGWKKGVDKDVTTITVASDTITANTDIKAIFFLLKITILYTPPCFQDN